MSSQNGFDQYLLPDTVEEVTLPSGMKVKLRSPGLDYYFGVGSLPSRLLRARNGEDQPTPGVDVIEPAFTPAEIWESTSTILCSVFVEPKLSTNPAPGDGTYNVLRLRPADASFVLNWATSRLKALYAGGAGVGLESFRTEPAGDRDAGGSGKNLVSAP